MSLADQWLRAQNGYLPAIEQAKLWALRAVMRKMGEDVTQYQWMAAQVRLVGGGHPTRQAVHKFFTRVDGDPDWYPGKRHNVGGRPRALTSAKRKRIAHSAMALKRRNMEPCYMAVKAQCPAALHNPTTGKPFSRTVINQVLTTDCYDHVPSKPWRFVYGPRRRPLTPPMMELRLKWARRLRRHGESAEWFHDNVIWADISSKVIPASRQKALEQDKFGRSKRKRLISPDARHASRHFAGTATAEKQCSQGDTRVWFFVALAHGRLGVHTFTDVSSFPGETQAGAAMCIERLPRMLTRMLGRNVRKPDILFTDRGPGFYNRRYGGITGDYEAACNHHGFTLWAGHNANVGPRSQPADIADMLLHETATSWIRAGLAKTGASLREPWTETPVEFGARMSEVIQTVNATCDVSGLCMQFPKRLLALIKTKGDRIAK